MAEDVATTEEPEAAEPEASEEPVRELPEEAGLAAIVEPFPSAEWVAAADEWVIVVDAAEYHDLVSHAFDSGFDTFVDLCAVDYFRRDPRFEVVLTVLDHSAPMRLRIRSGVAATDPSLPTVSDVLPGANFYEREAYDLMGIDFPGHPDLTRILLPDDWEGHPLRKDFAVGSVPVQFKEAHKVE